MKQKRDLPTKLCLHCGRPMVWRKKWARCWAEVTVCSDRCRAARRHHRPADPPTTAEKQPKSREKIGESGPEDIPLAVRP